MTENEKTKLLAAKITFGVVGVFIGLIILGLFLGRNTPKLTERDLLCRQLIRDGQEAKTQAEYDYAKKKFVDNCDGWKDPDKKE